MFLTTHLGASLIVGKLGCNYWAALIGGVATDVDHLLPYVEHGVLWRPKLFFKTITREDDPYGDQRGIFHNIFSWAGVSLIILAINRAWAAPFSAAYFIHLCLDALDSADFYPFWPIKKISIRGPIRYWSKIEFLLTAGFYLIFLLII